MAPAPGTSSLTINDKRWQKSLFKYHTSHSISTSHFPEESKSVQILRRKLTENQKKSIQSHAWNCPRPSWFLSAHAHAPADCTAAKPSCRTRTTESKFDGRKGTRERINFPLNKVCQHPIQHLQHIYTHSNKESAIGSDKDTSNLRILSSLRDHTYHYSSPPQQRYRTIISQDRHT